MISIRNTAALFLLSLALCTSIASAQPQLGPLGQESFTLTPDPVFDRVTVALEDDPDPDPKKVWRVVAGSAENAAKLSWKLDARCLTRLKSLSVKDAAGSTKSEALGVDTKNLQKTLVNLPSFSAPFIKQLCLDIANVTFVTAQGDAEKQEALKDLQKAFETNPEGWAQTSVDGGIFLSARCVNSNGNTTMSVTDKKFPAKVLIRCER